MLPRDNESSCEREVTLASGQSLPRGSSLSRVHVNRPLVQAKGGAKLRPHTGEGNSLTFGTGVLICLFGVCNLEYAKLFGA